MYFQIYHSKGQIKCDAKVSILEHIRGNCYMIKIHIITGFKFVLLGGCIVNNFLYIIVNNISSLLIENRTIMDFQ